MRNVFWTWCQRLVIGLGLLSAGTAAHAQQQFPSKPIRMTVPAAPGASTDTIARTLARSMGDITGQGVIVDNKAGASGSIGVLSVTQAAADGYTLLFSTVDPITVVPSVRKRVQYQVDKDLVPLTMVAESHFVFAVSAKSSATSLKEFIDLAAARPGQLKYSSAGLGTSGNLVMEVLKFRTGMDLLHVPYKGVAPSMLAVMSGDVHMVATTPASLKGHVENGNLKGLAIAKDARSPILPAVPTMAESGMKDFVVPAWFGVFAPAGTPPAVVDRLDEIILAAVRTPEYQKTMASLALDSKPISKAAFAKFISEDAARWRQIAERAKITVED